MQIENFEKLKVMYPDLQLGQVTAGDASCTWFYLPKGFKDIGVSLVFGGIRWGHAVHMQELFRRLDLKAVELRVTQIVGPLDFSTYFDYRVRVDHFELPPYIGEPQNPVDAEQILTQAGFQTLSEYVTHLVPIRLNWRFFFLCRIYAPLKKLISPISIEYRSFEASYVENYLAEIFEMTHDTFSQNYLYQKISFESFREIFEKKYLPNIDSRSSVLAFHEGTLIGYSLCLNDINNPHQMLFKTMGIKKSHRHRGLSALLLIREMFLRTKKTKALACLMIKGNSPERLNRKMSLLARHYKLFTKRLGEDRANS